MIRTTYTREEVEQMLVSVFMFASANNGQGISSIAGANFGEKANSVIVANEAIFNTNKSLLTVMSILRNRKIDILD